MSMKSKFLVIILLTMVLFTLTFSGVAAAKTLTLRFAHVCPGGDHPCTTSAMVFADIVEQKSDGTLKVNVYPDAVLGGERDIIENLQMGNIDLMWNSTGVTSNFVPSVDVFNLPFIFRDEEHFLKVAEGPIGKKLLEDFKEANLIGLAFTAPVFRVPMNNRGPINTPDDIKGLKIRLMEVPMHIATYKALGASPVPIPFSELYSSLQMGVVDANENAIGTFNTAKIYEVQKYLTILPVFVNCEVLIMSEKTWNKLNPDQKQAILDSVPEAAETMNRDYIKTGEDGLKIIEDYGIKINTPPSLEPFVEAVEGIYADFLEEHPELESVIDEIRSVE